MGSKSKIQWTDATWNIAVGCTKVDEDCKYCYMYRQSLNNKRYDPKQVRKTTSVFNLPLKHKETKSMVWEGRPLIFTSSLTDVFHEAIDPFRNEMWDIIRKCPHLIFQILTKRPERIKDHLPADWGTGWDNVWLGTSIGSQDSIHRIIELSKVPAKTRFLSIEPLHGPINFRWEYNPENWQTKDGGRGRVDQYEILRGIHWVIVGGESGNDNGPYKYRPCKIEWITSIIKACEENKIPAFVKQLGTQLAKDLELTDRHAGDIDEFPEYLQIRQFPLFE